MFFPSFVYKSRASGATVMPAKLQHLRCTPLNTIVPQPLPLHLANTPFPLSPPPFTHTLPGVCDDPQWQQGPGPPGGH
jgi:hypothetical protein